MATVKIQYPGNGFNPHFVNDTGATCPQLEPIFKNNLVMIPICDIPNGDTGAVDISGAYEFEADANTYQIGSLVYYSTVTGTVNQTATNHLVGMVLRKRTVGTKHFVTVQINNLGVYVPAE